MVERLLTWGGAAAAVFVLGSLGLHPLAAALLGLVVAVLVAGVLTAVAPAPVRPGWDERGDGSEPRRRLGPRPSGGRYGAR